MGMGHVRLSDVRQSDDHPVRVIKYIRSTCLTLRQAELPKACCCVYTCCGIKNNVLCMERNVKVRIQEFMSEGT
jgi:hypothetical protein